jgi:hypothetical protein
VTGTSKETSRALVVAAADAQDLEDFGLLTADVASALDLVLEPEILARHEDGEGAIRELLSRASAVPGPLIVLPAERRRPAMPDTAHEERRRALRARCVLVPSDASEDVAAGTRALHGRLSRAGVGVQILHVMTYDRVPRMWEGSGHHAAAWLDELCRRHGAKPDELKVVSGDPRHELRVHAGGASLVVLFWHHDSRTGHAAIVQSLLAQGIEVPHMLVPIGWMGTHASDDRVRDPPAGNG